MSTTVDSRVVEMRFDNRHFERNVSTTMSTLDKLKAKLGFKGATKGLEDVGSAAKKVDLSSIGKSADTVGLRFNAMYTIADQALRNITNSAMQAGKNIVSALTIDPVKTGLSEYETKINAIQVIKANTRGKNTMEEIEAALAELNDYADRTIYNYTQMTSNVGKFVAQGLDVKEASKAVQGLANLAGASGASAEDMARATYQMSQALGGTIRKIDWNSLRNANMATVELKNTLMDLARVEGIDIDGMIAEKGTFEDTLEKGWLTGKMFTKAMNIYSDVYSEAELKAMGFKDEQVKNFKDLAKMAAEATTEVKTFSQLWDVLKETAQSGWTQTWELIIGDFDTAKKMFTGLQNYFSDIINGWSQARNWVVEGVLNFTKPWTTIMEKLDGATGLGGIKDVVDNVKGAIGTLEEFQDIVNKVWRGDYNNRGDNPDRKDLLEGAGWNYDVVQDLVNKGYKYKLTMEDVEASHKKFGVTMGETAESTKDTSKAVDTMTFALENLSDEQLEQAGLTKDEIKLFRDIAEEAKRTGISFDEMVDKMSNVSGRTLLIDSFKNAWSGVLGIAKALGGAFADIFPAPSIPRIYTMIESLNKFSEKLRLTDKATGELTETGKKFQRIFKGVFAVIDIIATVLGGAFRIAFKIVGQVLDYFGIGILDAAAAVADAVVKFHDWFDSLFDIRGILDAIVPVIKKVVDTIRNWATAVKESEAFEVAKNIVQGLINGLRNGVSKVWAAALEIGRSVLESVKNFLGIHSPSTEFAEVGKNIIDGLIQGIQNGASRIWATIKKLFSTIVKWVKQIDFGALLASGIGIGMIVVMNKIANALSVFEGLGDLLGGLGNMLTGIGKAIKSYSKNLMAQAIKNFAISLAILVAAVIALAYVCGKDEFKIWEAIGVIGALAGILIAMAVATSLMSKSSVKIKKNGAQINNLMPSLIGIGAALLMMGLVVKLIGSMNPEAAKQGFFGLAGVMLAIVAVMAACKLLVTDKSAKNIDKVGKMIFKISVAMLLLVGVAKLIAGMSWGDMGKATIGILGLVGIITLLMNATKAVGPNADKIGGTLVKVSIAMGVLVLVAKLIAGMSWDEMGKAAVGLLGLVGIVAALMLVTRIAGNNIAKVGGTIMGIAAAILMLALVTRLIGGMDETALKKGIVLVLIFSAIITGLIAATKLVGQDAGKVGATILAFSVAIGLLALTATLLGLVKLENLAKGVIAVSLLSAMMALMISATRGAQDCKGNLIVMVVAVGLIAAAVAGLSFIDPTKLAAASASLSAVMGMFALLIFVMQYIKTGQKTFQRNLATIGVLTLVVGALSAVIFLLSKCDPEAALPATVALSLLTLSLAATMLILSKVNGKTATNALKGALALTAMVVPLALFAAALYFMPNVYKAKKNVESLLPVLTVMTALLIPLTAIGALGGFKALTGVLALTAMVVPLAAFAAALAFMPAFPAHVADSLKALVTILTAMTLLLVPLTLIGLGGWSALLGVLALTAMVVPLAAFALALALLPDISSTTSTVELLVGLMTSLTTLLVPLTLIGLLAPFALAGIGALAALGALMLEFGKLAAVIAVVNTLFPDLSKFLDSGIDILAQLASGLGRVIASFVTGFAGEVMTILPALGTNLSLFMDNAAGFIAGAKLIDENVLAGVGILAAAILALTAANLINGMVSFLPCAGSLAVLGTQLSMFMMNAMPFIIGASMISEEMVSGVKALSETILILTAANVLEGLTSWLAGGSSLENFASQLPILGRGLVAFSASLGTFTEDQLATVNCAAQAIKTLAQASSEIPNTGGLLAAIVGNNDLGVFASQFPILGTGLSLFLANIGTFTDQQLATVNCAAQAIKTLAQASAEIPNAGGWLGQIVGENDLGIFASQFPILGTGLAQFLVNLGTFTDKQVKTVECASTAIKSLAQASAEIPNTGGWLAAIVGDNDLSVFASQLPNVGAGLAGLLTNLGTFTDEQVKTVDCAANAIKSLATTSNGIPNTGGWLAGIVGDNDLGTFASQLPNVGAGIKGFVDKLGTFTQQQVSTVTAGVNAIYALAKLANADLKRATKNIGDFGGDLPGFGANLASFCSSMPSADTVASAVDGLNKLLSAIDNIADCNAGALSTLVDNLKKVGEDAVKKFVGAFTSHSTKTDVESAAKKLGDKVVDGVEAKESAVEKAAKNVAKKAVSGLSSQDDEAKTAGKNLGAGYIKGVNAKKQAAYDAGFALGAAAASGINDGQESQSPSKLAAQSGKWLGEGYVIGIGKMGGQVYKAGHTLGETATDSLSSSISRISDLVSSDIDSQPTIRPVLDLSDVESGVSALGGMFGAGSIGVRANLGAISSMMSARGQNGTNADIVSAIDKLNKKMDNVGNTTYQINGITYDDGSNITDAVATLVRAARIERRV